MGLDNRQTTPFLRSNSAFSKLDRFFRNTDGNLSIEYGLLIMLVGVTMAGAFSMVANSRVDQTIAEIHDILAPANENATRLAEDKKSPNIDDTILTGSTKNSGLEEKE